MLSLFDDKNSLVFDLFCTKEACRPLALEIFSPLINISSGSFPLILYFYLRIRLNRCFSCRIGRFNIMSAYLLSLLLTGVALAMPTTPNNLYNPRKLLSRADPSIQATDPFDRRWIETLTAVGDSYSVGLGAGHAVKGTSRVQHPMSGQVYPQLNHCLLGGAQCRLLSIQLRIP